MGLIVVGPHHATAVRNSARVQASLIRGSVRCLIMPQGTEANVNLLSQLASPARLAGSMELFK